MEQTPVVSAPSRSFPKWIIFVLGLLIGGGVGYGMFAYFAPNAEEIRETVRLDMESRQEFFERRVSGVVKTVDGDSFTVEMTFEDGISRTFTLTTNEETEFDSLSGTETSESIIPEVNVAVLTDTPLGNKTDLTAVRVTILK